MRLRQLLGICLMLAVSGAIAAAATSELKNVGVVSQGKSTIITLNATGGFGHNEYRASENLLLVDLTGVSVGKMKDNEHSVKGAGVQSYRVVGYKGMGGVDVARLELRVAPDAEVSTANATGGLRVTVTTKTGAEAEKPTAALKPAQVSENAASPEPSKTPVSAHLVSVRNVSVVRGKSGIDIEVNGTGPMTGKVLKLSAPDRIVVDIPNSKPERTPVVAVNSANVKSIRTSKYQLDPPVTRVVVDLLSAHDYELNAIGNKLVLKLRPATTSVPVVAKESSVPSVPKTETPAPKPVIAEAAKPVVVESRKPQVVEPPKQAPEQNAKLVQVAQTSSQTLAAKPEPKGGSDNGADAKPVVFVEPKYQPKQQENGDPATAADKKAEPAAQVAAVQQPANQPAVPTAKQSTPQSTKPVYTGEPISVNLKDVDLKDFFRLIHEISGLNVVLDPGVNGTLTLVLDDVPWDQALDIVLKNNGLDRQLDGNVLRVATVENLRKEAQAKRLQVEAEELAIPKVSVTRFLSYARAKDVTLILKKVLSARGDVVSDDRLNAVVIQDIPSVIPEVDRLLAQLDRKTREVDIEARVVAATRTFKRDIGTQLGAGFGNGPTAIGGASAVGDSPIGGIASNPMYIMGATNKKSIPLITNFLPTSPSSGLSFINETSSYRVDLIIAAAERRGLLKILSRPHVVTQNNVQAIVKQGMKIPITTQAQLNGPPTTTYVEAVLRLTVTPQITVDNTIFLSVDVENTQPDFSNVLQGNPVFLTQQATTQVLVTDGGTVMIGGVIQTSNSVTTQQTPFVGNVPILGNLFKRRAVDNSTQELIFIITPKIVQT